METNDRRVYASSPATSATTRSPNHDTGATLVLVGAILALVLTAFGALVFLLIMVAMGPVMGRMSSELPAGFGSMFAVWGVILALSVALHIVGLVLAFGGRRMALDGNAERGWLRALIGGILIVLTNQLAGMLIIVGAALIKPVQAVSPTPTATAG